MRMDSIVDHDGRTDVIDMSAIDANSRTARDDAFRFIGSDFFGGNAGELRYAGGVVHADTNGDGRADIRIEISNSRRLDALDFDL
jgi:serralysin